MMKLFDHKCQWNVKCYALCAIQLKIIYEIERKMKEIFAKRKLVIFKYYIIHRFWSARHLLISLLTFPSFLCMDFVSESKLNALLLSFYVNIFIFFCYLNSCCVFDPIRFSFFFTQNYSIERISLTLSKQCISKVFINRLMDSNEYSFAHHSGNNLIFRDNNTNNKLMNKSTNK